MQEGGKCAIVEQMEAADHLFHAYEASLLPTNYD